MIPDTLFALVKLGYLYAMWQVIALSSDAICKGHRALPVLALAFLLGTTKFMI